MKEIKLPQNFELRQRPRRLRTTAEMRSLFQETSLSSHDFIYPLFVTAKEDVCQPIKSLPGQFRYSVDRLDPVVQELQETDVKAVLLFGIPDKKDAKGEAAYDPEGPVPRALRRLRTLAPNLVLMADVCLCEYTDHGHCGVLDGEHVLNDASLEGLAKAAVCYAAAGADVLAPSAMMDGQVKMLRESLDLNGFKEAAIMGYSSKFASAFYEPFRDAADSAPQFGDRKSYQMNPANRREAIFESLLDLDEGADMLLVKPSLAYMDILAELRQRTEVPLAAYMVSGEYAMLHATAEQGLLNLDKILLETHLALKRAGADLIITYAALELARKLADRG